MSFRFTILRINNKYDTVTIKNDDNVFAKGLGRRRSGPSQGGRYHNVRASRTESNQGVDPGDPGGKGGRGDQSEQAHRATLVVARGSAE